MDTLRLNNSLEVSKIILGGAFFGTYMSKEKSFEIMDYYFNNGGNTIDTARVYCEWVEGCEYKSEETIGEWVKKRNNRDKVKIITKGGHPSFKSEAYKSRLSEEDIRNDMEVSLKTLQMNYVDLYLLHRDDENTPVSDIMDTLHKLILEGKTKAIGVSNWKIERIIQANDYAAKTGKTPLCVSEIQWSLAECFPKTFDDETLICMNNEIYDKYIEIGMKVLAYSSQAGGVFSCGYKKDLEDIADKHKKYLSDENIKRYNKLINLCEEKKYKPSAVAIEYITDNKLQSSAIVGCSSVNQLAESMKATENKLTFDQIELLV